MTDDLPFASQVEMDRRAALADEFYRVTEAEPAPFVSDEATWYAFDYLTDDEVIAIIESHYGVKIDAATLTMPFWSLLDLLDANRTTKK
jgi:predicted phosphoribosyltransferase